MARPHLQDRWTRRRGGRRIPRPRGRRQRVVLVRVEPHELVGFVQPVRLLEFLDPVGLRGFVDPVELLEVVESIRLVRVLERFVVVLEAVVVIQAVVVGGTVRVFADPELVPAVGFELEDIVLGRSLVGEAVLGRFPLRRLVPIGFVLGLEAIVVGQRVLVRFVEPVVLGAELGRLTDRPTGEFPLRGSVQSRILSNRPLRDWRRGRFASQSLTQKDSSQPFFSLATCVGGGPVVESGA